MEFLLWLQQIRTEAVSNIFQFFTLFGEEAFVFCVICAIYWCIEKKLAYRIGFVFFASGMLVQVLKVTFRVPRPWILDPRIHPAQSALHSATGFSFPSGHTQASCALFSTLSLYCKSLWVTVPLMGLSVMVGFSRMALGVHTPADVAVSFVLTLLLAVLLSALLSKKEQNPIFGHKAAILLFALSILVAAYGAVLFFSGTVTLAMVSDCFKAAGAGAGFALAYAWERSCILFDERRGSILFQIAKFAIGIAVVLILKLAFRAELALNPLADFLRYFCIAFFVVGLYPFLFSHARGYRQVNAKRFNS